MGNNDDLRESAQLKFYDGFKNYSPTLSPSDAILRKFDSPELDQEIKEIESKEIHPPNPIKLFSPSNFGMKGSNRLRKSPKLTGFKLHGMTMTIMDKQNKRRSSNKGRQSDFVNQSTEMNNLAENNKSDEMQRVRSNQRLSEVSNVHFTHL